MISKVLLKLCNFVSEHFSKYFHIHDFVWFPDCPAREIRSMLFYKGGAESQRGWALCPKSPWISIRACVKAVVVFIWVHVSVTGLPASLPSVLSHAQASGNVVGAILLGESNCLVGKRLWDTTFQECPCGRGGDRRNQQAKAGESLIANLSLIMSKTWLWMKPAY